MILLKLKNTMDCNWPNSLESKKNQKGNVKEEEDWLLQRHISALVCMLGGNFNEPSHL